MLRSVQGVSFVNVTDEMKYFTKYESHGNYNQSFSYGDGYNALGYYQFDRRWSLIPFMKQVYNYDSAKYGMLKDAIDRGGEISNGSNPMYANGQLTELGHIAQDAFLGAYNTDPAEFSALQDAYAYNSYYAVTESWLKNALGIDISGRADCVKGMVWSITNMCGTGGCQDFFRWANLSNSMTDREFVTALSNSVVDNVARKYSSQPQYHEGWKNRYKNELKDCLVYIAEDEAAAATPVEPDPEPAPAPGPSMAPAAPAAPTPGTDGDAGDSGDTDAPSTDTGSDDAGNGGATSGGTAAGDASGGSSTSGSDGAEGGSTSGSTDTGASNGAGDSSADAGSSNGSGSDASEGGSSEGSITGDSSKENKPSAGEQLGSMLGSSLMAGVNGGSSSDEGASEQGSGSNVDSAADASANAGAKQSDADAQKAGDKGGATTTTTTTTTKASGGNMPKTGDLIVMASLASASLATLGATSIVSGKHKLDQQNKAAGEDGSEE